MELGNLSWWDFVAVVVGAFILLFAGFLRNRLMQKQKPQLPPGHMGWPLIGNTISFLRAYKSQNPQSFLNDLKKRYGATGIYKSHLFWNPSILVCSPELCRKVFTDDEHFASGYNLSDVVFGGKSFDILSPPMRKRFRRLVTGGINGTESLSTQIESIEKFVIDTLEESAKIDQPIEFHTKTKEIGFKVIMNIYLGFVSDKSVMESLNTSYEDLFRGLFSAPINIPGFTYYKALKARKKLVEINQAILAEKERRNLINDPNTKKGLIDLIKDEVEDEEGEKLDDKLLLIVYIFLLVGFETVGRAMTWATIFLHQHPQVLQKAKEEQEEIIKRRPSSQKSLNLSEIKQMKYLSKVIDEALRMRLNTFANYREAIKDTELNGYFIPKGWKVLVFQSAVHMDPEIYSNPHEFLPSRWDEFKPKAGTFHPFGVGSMACPGADLAKLLVFIFLHHFLLNYKLEQVNPGGPVIYLPAPDPVDNCLAKIIKLR